jgi:hypothetical protein
MIQQLIVSQITNGPLLIGEHTERLGSGIYGRENVGV